MQPSTKEKIKKIIAEQAGISLDAVKDDAALSGLGLDSLDMVEAVMEVEDACGVMLPDFAMNLSMTVNDFMLVVEKHWPVLK